jgi:eukaryotic-like serine/threonine-protein kinase
MRVTLTVIEGPHEGKSFSFAEHDNFIVGRSRNAHFRLANQDKYFSRFHFMVEVNPPSCRLLDLGSRNGTYVNGTKVGALDLKDGDLIRAGRTVLRLAVESAEPPGSTCTYAPQVSPTASTLIAPPPGNAPPPVTSFTTASTVPGATLPPCPACHPETPGGPLCDSCLEQSRQQTQNVPGYLLIRPVGRGSMGIVSLARRDSDGQILAIKTIAPAVSGTPAQVGRFVREAGILRELDHPNIVRFHDVGEVQGLLYFAMEYVPGTDAKQLLARHGPLPLSFAVRLVSQALRAIGHAHSRGFVHRDVKPGNLLVGGTEGKRVVKLADFGLARIYQASQLSGLTLLGEVGGTPAFMPPEQVLNYRTTLPPADQYAAAATLYTLLTQKFLFDAGKDPQEWFAQILQRDHVPLRRRQPALPVELEAVVHRALAKEPSERYPDVEAFRHALVPFAR